MMEAGDERIVADRLHALLSKPITQPAAPPPASAVADLTGQWNVSIEFAAAKSTHTLLLTQRGNELGGFHHGEFVTREISGTIDGDSVRIRSAYGEQHGDSVNLTFSGKVVGDQMTGTLDMGEYLGATWTAARRAARRA
jgi:L-seryl-tRNA(Ser) seleniumtransferase